MRQGGRIANHTARTAATPIAGANQRTRQSGRFGRMMVAGLAAAARGTWAAATNSPSRATSFSAKGVSSPAARTARIFLQREHAAKCDSHCAVSSGPSACSW